MNKFLDKYTDAAFAVTMLALFAVWFFSMLGGAA